MDAGELTKSTAESGSWYAIQTRSRQEKVVSLGLQAKGYEELLPLWSYRDRWSRKIEKPLFPGYVFCKFDIERRLPVLTTPGVVRVVGVGKMPVPVFDSEIEAIQQIVENGLQCEPLPFLREGEPVRVCAGPLTGIEGRFVTAKGAERLVVSISLLQRSVAIEIDKHWVRPLQSTRTPRLPAALAGVA